MSGRTGYPDTVTDQQIHKLSKELLVNGADHDDVGRVRSMLKDWQNRHHGRRQVSAWIDGLLDENPAMAGRAAMDVCQRADSHHFSSINRQKRDAA